jgi:hypothetical protein
MHTHTYHGIAVFCGKFMPPGLGLLFGRPHMPNQLKRSTLRCHWLLNHGVSQHSLPLSYGGLYTAVNPTSTLRLPKGRLLSYGYRQKVWQYAGNTCSPPLASPTQHVLLPV